MNQSNVQYLARMISASPPLVPVARSNQSACAEPHLSSLSLSRLSLIFPPIFPLVPFSGLLPFHLQPFLAVAQLLLLIYPHTSNPPSHRPPIYTLHLSLTFSHGLLFSLSLHDFLLPFSLVRTFVRSSNNKSNHRRPSHRSAAVRPAHADGSGVPPPAVAVA